MSDPKRKKMYRSLVYNFFEWNETTKEYKCNECNSSFKIKHAGTLKAHLKRFHCKTFGEMLKAENDVRLSKGNNSDNKIKLQISISPEGFRRSLVDLVSVHGRPFSLIDDAAFREIIDPILEALPAESKFNVNRNSVCDMLKVAAVDFRDSIAAELMDIPLISLKIDIGTRHCRSFLGINIQFIKDGKLHLRTLAVQELMDAHTSENLRVIVEDVFQEYNIPLEKLYSFTSDSGSNMIKLHWRLQNEHENHIEEDTNSSNRSPTLELDLDLENEAGYSDDTFSDSSIDPVEAEENLLSAYENCGLAILQSVRCGLHTLQLAVLEVLKDGPMKATILKARNVVKCLRKDSCLKSLKLYNINKPVLDVPTRWNSTADMLSSLLSAKQFCKDFQATVTELALTDIEWKRIEECLTALQPCKVATLRLQKENLLPGDFFSVWCECKIRTKDIDTPLSRKIFEAIEKREKPLLENEALLASMFLDPRVLPFLSINNCNTAKETLKKIWRIIMEKSISTVAQNNNSAGPSTATADKELPNNDLPTADDCLIDIERKRLEEERQKRFNNVEEISIDKQLNDFEQVPSIPLKEDLLDYWEVRKAMMPELYSLAKIVHAVPMTQVSVERLFSGMRFIFSHLRANLSHDLLNDILILRTNKNFLKNTEEQSKNSNKRNCNASNINELESFATTRLMSQNSLL